MADPCRIRVLPELVVRKIAAGEVVERPASVVKELVENAIDAGSTRIAIGVEDGGRQLIRVTDDGSGMNAEELRLSVAPHATSKITSEDDLNTVNTLGFRGEALASISAVSRMRIVSRTAEGEGGFELKLTGDELQSAQFAGSAVGTTVEVRDLFFNVPARRKFLKTVSTEVGHIQEQFARLALAYPQIAFELINNSRTVHNLPSCGHRLERISRFYGHELANALLSIHRDERGVRIEAYTALPAHSRATPNWQYTFVNGRYIRDKFVQHAIKEAYRGLIEPNRHAVIFLFLTVDPTTVDVNVHPTKMEVRWADSNSIHSQVLSALRETFQRANLSPKLQFRPAPTDAVGDEQSRMEEFAAAVKTAIPVQPYSGPGMNDNRSFEAQPSMHTRAELPASPRMSVDGLDSWRQLYYPETDARSTRSVPPPIDRMVERFPATPAAEAVGSEDHTRPRAIQMHNLYLVVESDDGILIVDQHALHERVMYEQLRTRLLQGRLESQRLLLPESVSVTARQADLLEKHGALLQSLGIELTPFGADSVAVHTFPVLLKDADVVGFMRDLLDQLERSSSGAQAEEMVHDILDMMACKAAVKAGDVLTVEEIDALVQQRHLIDRATSCPHGRPTMLRLTKSDLNRQFKRT